MFHAHSHFFFNLRICWGIYCLKAIDMTIRNQENVYDCIFFVHSDPLFILFHSALCLRRSFPARGTSVGPPRGTSIGSLFCVLRNSEGVLRCKECDCESLFLPAYPHGECWQQPLPERQIQPKSFWIALPASVPETTPSTHPSGLGMGFGLPFSEVLHYHLVVSLNITLTFAGNSLLTLP